MAKEEVTTSQQVSQTRTGIRTVAVPETLEHLLMIELFQLHLFLLLEVEH